MKKKQDIVTSINNYLSSAKESKVVVNLNSDHIAQTSLRRYLDIKHLKKDLTKEENNLKAALIQALKDGRKAQEGPGNLRVSLIENSGRPSWKDEAIALAMKLGLDIEAFVEDASDRASTKKSYSVKVD